MSCCKCYDKLGQIIINDTVLATNALLLITKSISFDDTSLITSYKLFRNIKRTFCFRWARNRKHTNKCSNKKSVDTQTEYLPQYTNSLWSRVQNIGLKEKRVLYHNYDVDRSNQHV